MIQILLQRNEKYTQAELAQKAIEAGCQWLVLPDASTAALRADAQGIIDLCREAGVILTVENNIEACREFGLHGVLLRTGANPAAVRADIGAEAVIGAEIASAAAATALAKADIDYFMISENAAPIIAEARKAGVEVHFVADLTAATATRADVDRAMSLGFSGAYISASQFTGDDAAADIAALIPQP